MSVFLSIGDPQTELTSAQLQRHLTDALRSLGPRKRVLVVPPDQTRFHSRAGELTGFAYDFYRDRVWAILPALGTHAAMSPAQLTHMFPDVPLDLFRVHRWRTDIETLGEVPGDYIYKLSEARLNYEYPAQVNTLISRGDSDLVLSIGQVVPHEVIGMANYNKNILVGTGGRDGINRSHYLGAVYGMERIMGRADNPVREMLNYAANHFLSGIPIVYVLTVVARADDGRLVVRGLFIGDDIECFHQAAALSLQVNFVVLDKPLSKAVVYLDPDEFRSTWLGNKAIYRTRMALADNAQLIILAPGLKEFGEDGQIDALIRKYGYRGTPATLAAVEEHTELAEDLSAAAHLIHGSSEGRFNITYCPGTLTREEIESVGFQHGDLTEMLQRYDPSQMKPGYNTIDGESVFYISNPGLGLWAHRDRLLS